MDILSGAPVIQAWSEYIVFPQKTHPLHRQNCTGGIDIDIIQSSHQYKGGKIVFEPW